MSPSLLITMPDPRLRWLCSRGDASPKKRLKNSSIGSFDPLRGERCEVVEILTTTGMVRLAMAANEGGRAPSTAAKLAAWEGVTQVSHASATHSDLALER